MSVVTYLRKECLMSREVCETVDPTWSLSDVLLSVPENCIYCFIVFVSQGGKPSVCDFTGSRVSGSNFKGSSADYE